MEQIIDQIAALSNAISQTTGQHPTQFTIVLPGNTIGILAEEMEQWMKEKNMKTTGIDPTKDELKITIAGTPVVFKKEPKAEKEFDIRMVASTPSFPKGLF